LKISRKSLLAICLLALAVTGLTVALLFVGRDVAPDAAPIAAPDAGAEAPVAPRGRGIDEREPQTWVLELGDSGEPGGRTSIRSRDAASELSMAQKAIRELPRGSARIAFAVQDASGRPQPDVSVLLESLDRDGGGELAVTGAEGEARFLDLAPGLYAYQAQAPGGSESASYSLQLEPADDKHLTLRLAGSGLSIAGRVQNQQGEPVAGIGVSVVRHRFASAVSEVDSGHPSRRSTRTDASGAFAIGGLDKGEHDVLTSSTDRYPSVKVVVQAGTASVDLILAEGLDVQGIVTNPNGEPLARVWVGLNARRDRFAYTDAAGSYKLQLDLLSEDSDRSVRFYLQGYEEERLALPSPVDGGGRLDAELRPVENAARVDGVVQSDGGEPIAGATIVLGSRELGTNYQALSDADGAFSVPGAKIGPGYNLRVLPSGRYLDFTRHEIEVPEDGLSIEVVLESLSTGRLVGHMVDAEGNPVSGFRLWVVPSAATRSALPITSDERGDFELEEAPAGPISFDTRASPRLQQSGIVLPAGGEREVVLVLDWGEHELTGEVIGEGGDPIAGAEVSLSWSHANGDVRSTSHRATRTDPSGTFRFSQLGPGRHRLDVHALGYHDAQEHHEVGRPNAEIKIRLESDTR
jgi:hypothetical protein